MTDVGPTDPFADARSNLRDTVKWLITALAGLAAIVLGGSPLTEFGTLSPGWRLYLAIGTGSLGLLFVFIAIFLAFRLLVWEPFFLSDLAKHEELSKLLEEHASDLLPSEYQKVDDFLKARNAARAVLMKAGSDTSAEKRTNAEQFIDQSDPYVDKLLSLAHFEYLRRRLVRSAWMFFTLAICTVVALGAFAWAANPTGKKGESSRSISSEH
jgi:hypothetical protein